jgi:transcription antitermination protein NusB
VSTRREIRRIAIDILYQADITGDDPALALESWVEAGRDVPPYARELVDGVVAHGPEIDLLLEEHTQGWTVARMAALDRTILRAAVEELRYRDDVPDSVAISEAVEMASELSSDESRSFVNGILGKIARS